MLKMVVVANGFLMPMVTSESALVFRNVVGLAVQESASTATIAVNAPRRILLLQSCTCSDRKECPCGVDVDDANRWHSTLVFGGGLQARAHKPQTLKSGPSSLHPKPERVRPDP